MWHILLTTILPSEELFLGTVPFLYTNCMLNTNKLSTTNPFCCTFIVNLCRQSFYDFRKKDLDQNGPYINTFQTNLRKICVSVILEFCLLSFSSLLLTPAYVSTVYYSSWTSMRQIFYFWDYFLRKDGSTALLLKKLSQKLQENP